MSKERVSLLILGAGGDLTKRLLVPGLASLLSVHDYDVQLLGSGLDERSQEQWKSLVHDSFSGEGSGPARDRVLEGTRYITADATDPDDLKKLFEACDGTPVVYFALPPAVTAKVCETMAHVQLPKGIRLALEKPFGVDLESARRLNGLLKNLVPETQIFRIDHFLGMTTVLNMLGLRFSNKLLEGVWNRDSIDRVDIRYDETLGLEGRGGYYDHSGALVDMIQSHLLEVLAFFALERPDRVDEAELRDRVVEVLRETSVWQGDPVASSHRARYTAGTVGDRSMPSYVDEAGVDPALNTETLAEVTLAVDTPRWKGVPFTLRSGKALASKRTQVVATFKETHTPEGIEGVEQPDVVVLELRSGAVELHLTMNGGGDPFRLERATLTATQEPGQLLPYGEVLKGILDGDPTLSVRGDVAEECWRIVEPVLAAWKAGTVVLEDYPAGSQGPEGWPL
ncbi:glucose-6-phosphate dehydrogenase [Rathayibacter sp. YIM 133350]|uniref:glucose-6-phosphate dehydrogenase n=1 Tax=Rathayibacter sp. YIM 133350 TaxID=3131992 RepID=UPI00307F2EF2